MPATPVGEMINVCPYLASLLTICYVAYGHVASSLKHSFLFIKNFIFYLKSVSVYSQCSSHFFQTELWCHLVLHEIKLNFNEKKN